MTEYSGPYTHQITWVRNGIRQTIRVDGGRTRAKVWKVAQAIALQHGCQDLGKAEHKSYPCIRTAHARWKRGTGMP